MLTQWFNELNRQVFGFLWCQLVEHGIKTQRENKTLEPIKIENG